MGIPPRPAGPDIRNGAFGALFARSPPDAGAGILPFMGLGALAANRAVGVPLNAYWARNYNSERFGPAFASSATPLKGVLNLGVGGYRMDGSISIGLALEFKRMGLKISHGVTEGDIPF